MALVALGILHGERSPYGIGQWVTAHQEELLAWLKPSRSALPSASTIRRALEHIDVERAEEQLRRFAKGQTGRHQGDGYQGLALDGKRIRGAHKHGRPVQLLSAVCHDTGVVVAQVEVESQKNESDVAPALLAQVALQERVVTTDALLTQKKLCRQIVAQGGHYLMVVKDNQPQLKADIAALFEEPP